MGLNYTCLNVLVRSLCFTQAQAVLYDGQGNALSPEEYATLQEEIDQQLFMDEVEFEHYQNRYDSDMTYPLHIIPMHY